VEPAFQPQPLQHQQNVEDPHAVGHTEVASPPFTAAETARNNLGKFRGLQQVFLRPCRFSNYLYSVFSPLK
jgi:hypothetical protein